VRLLSYAVDVYVVQVFVLLPAEKRYVLLSEECCWDIEAGRLRW
jgi:hypothetical protein